MDVQKIAGIYKIESPTGKIYIGQSYDIYDRWKMHKWYAKKFFSYAIYRSMTKHGVDAHTFTIVHELPQDVSKEVITQYEQIYMDAYRECGFQMLNMTTEAGTTKGRMHTEEAKRKMSESKKGKGGWEKGVLAATAVNKGNKYSLGNRHSNETRKKMSESKMGNKSSVGNVAWNKGVVPSDETRKRMSDAAKKRIRPKGFKFSLESRMKMSESAKGKIISDETKKKMAAFHTGRTRSDETKRKMRESWVKKKERIANNK